jgi:hypothetical protein
MSYLGSNREVRVRDVRADQRYWASIGSRKLYPQSDGYSSRGKVDNETASLTEEDRLDAVHWLLAAAQELLSQGHPDTNLQTVVERWIGTQASFITTPGAS